MTKDEIAAQVMQAFGGKPARFRPCAFFDDRLDCIRVVARDCSVLETRINEVLTILEDNYASEGAIEQRYVGFTIKGIRHLCYQNQIPLSAPINLSNLLDKIIATCPEPAVRVSIDLMARPLIKKARIKNVELPKVTAEPQPA